MADSTAKLEIVASVKDQMTKVLRVAQASFKTFFGAVGKGFSSLGKALLSVKGLLAGAFVFLGGRALVNHTEELARTVGQYELWSNRLGVTVGWLDELTVIAEQQGGSFESLTAGLKGLRERQDKAAAGAGEMREQFRRLGVDTVDPLTGQLRELTDLVPDIADAFERLRSQGRGGEISAISDRLLGGTDGALATLLQLSPKALAAMEDLAFATGRVTEEQARMGVVMTQAFVEFDRSLRDFKLDILLEFGDEIVATLRTTAQFLRENSQDIISFLGDVAALGIGIAKTVGNVVLTVIRAVLDAIDFITGKIEKLQTGFSTAWRVMTGGLNSPAPSSGADRSVDQARQNLDQLDGQIGSLGLTFDEFSAKWVTQWESNRQAALTAMQQVGEQAEKTPVKLLNGWQEFWSGWGDGFQEWRQGLREFDQLGRRSATEVFSSIDVGLSGFIASVIKGTERIGDAWKTMLRGILEDWIDTFARIASRNLLEGLFNGLLGGLFSGGPGGPLTPGGEGIRNFGGGGGGLVPGGSIASFPGGGGFGGGNVTNNTYVINAIDAPSFEQRLAQSSKTLHAIHADGLQNNQALRAMARRR